MDSKTMKKEQVSTVFTSKIMVSWCSKPGFSVAFGCPSSSEKLCNLAAGAARATWAPRHIWTSSAASMLS